MEIFEDVEQGSDIWLELRRGIPTASMFKVLVTIKGDQKGRTTYLYKLAGERITKKPMVNYVNEAMEEGKAVEPELREHYAFVRDCEPKRIGFIRNGKCGASPDALIGDDGILEIKKAAPHLLIPLVLKNEFPNEHYAQCQGGLLVSGRKWADLLIGYPGMKPLIVHCERDEPYIARLRDAIDVFDLELRRLVEKLK